MSPNGKHNNPLPRFSSLKSANMWWLFYFRQSTCLLIITCNKTNIQVSRFLYSEWVIKTVVWNWIQLKVFRLNIHSLLFFYKKKILTSTPPLVFYARRAKKKKLEMISWLITWLIMWATCPPWRRILLTKRPHLKQMDGSFVIQNLASLEV